MRIRVLLLSFLFLASGFISAQTVFWTENFGVGCNDSNLANGTITVNGTWATTLTGFNDQEANVWYISAAEQSPGIGCSSGCGGTNSRSLHVGPVSVSFLGIPVIAADGGAHYSAQGVNFPATTDVRVESPTINCTGQSTITLNFNYLEFGDLANDDGEVWYFDGAVWTLLTNPAKTTCCGGPCNNFNQGSWTAFSFALPASADNNPNVKLGFRWINNDDGTGFDPSYAIDDITLSVPSAVLPVVTITVPNDSLCQSSTLNLTGSATNGPITAWAWTASPSAGVVFVPDTFTQSPSVTFTTPGTYTLTLQATNGTGNGSTTQVITVLPVSAPSVTITANPLNPVCAGTTINFTATPTNGGTSPSYAWAVNGTSAGSNSPNFSSATLANNDVVTVTVTTSDSCSSSPTAADSYTVLITPTVVPSVTIAPAAPTACQGSAINFTATPTNGGTTPAYQWQVNGVNAGGNSPNFSSATLNTGDTVAVILTSNDACPNPATATDTVYVVITPTVAPSATITANPINPVCPGSTVNFTVTETNGGTTPAYQWQVNGSNVGTNINTFSSATLANNDVVSVIVTSNAVCVTPATVTATYTMQVVTMTVNVAGTATVCPSVSDTLVATAAAGSTFSWTPAANLNATNNDTAIANIATPGTYTYFVTATLNGCTATDSIQVTVTNFTISAGAPQTICFGNTAILSVSGGSSWNWTPTATLNCDTCQNPVATPTATTTYTVVADNGICTDTAMQLVTVIPNAGPSFGTSVVTAGIPQTISFTNTSNNATGFYWTFGNGNTTVLQTPPNQIYPAVGAYTVTLIAYGVNGCNDTISTVILVNDSVGITVPNIFTPNGDQINDVWQPSAHGATSFECTIFDRWGIKIYEFLNAKDKWDGHTTAGLACGDGTYYYIMKATDSNNKSYNLKGFIQLIR